MARLAPLRRITAQLTTPASPLEPITVLLECGHTGRSTAGTIRARCGSCKTALRIQQASKRMSHKNAARRIESSVSAIFIVRDARMEETGRLKGPRVFRIVLQDVTPKARHGRRPKAQTLDLYRVACDASSVEFVRAEVARMLAEIDGSIVVT